MINIWSKDAMLAVDTFSLKKRKESLRNKRKWRGTLSKISFKVMKWGTVWQTTKRTNERSIDRSIDWSPWQSLLETEDSGTKRKQTPASRVRIVKLCPPESGTFFKATLVLPCSTISIQKPPAEAKNILNNEGLRWLVRLVAPARPNVGFHS